MSSVQNIYRINNRIVISLRRLDLHLVFQSICEKKTHKFPKFNAYSIEFLNSTFQISQFAFQ